MSVVETGNKILVVPKSLSSQTLRPPKKRLLPKAVQMLEAYAALNVRHRASRIIRDDVELQRMGQNVNVRHIDIGT